MTFFWGRPLLLMPYSSGSSCQAILLAVTPPGFLLGLTGEFLPLELEEEEEPESDPDPDSSSEAELSEDLYPYKILN